MIPRHPDRALPRAVVVAVGLLVLAVAGGACSKADGSVSGGSPTSAGPTTAAGAPEGCREEFVRFRVAVERYRRERGRYPTTVDELRRARLVHADDTRYTVQPRPQAGTPPAVVPSPGSPCPARPKSPVLRKTAAIDAACATDLETLKQAAQTYEMLNGKKATSVDELVAGQFLVDEPTTYTIASDGSIVPLPGSGCL